MHYFNFMSTFIKHLIYVTSLVVLKVNILIISLYIFLVILVVAVVVSEMVFRNMMFISFNIWKSYKYLNHTLSSSPDELLYFQVSAPEYLALTGLRLSEQQFYIQLSGSLKTN